MPRIDEGVGYKAGETALHAAEAMVPRAPIIRTMVIEALRAKSPLGADEIAKEIGVDFLSVRPRLSELHEQGRVRDSGHRTTSRSGRQAIAWELTQKEPPHA